MRMSFNNEMSLDFGIESNAEFLKRRKKFSVVYRGCLVILQDFEPTEIDNTAPIEVQRLHWRAENC